MVPFDPISVVVPTRDRPELLDGCLRSVRRALGDRDELIVVDSASGDASAIHDVADRYGARYVRCDEPGASLARNAGWGAAAHPVVAFIDDDIRVDEGWARAVSGSFASHDVAFITGYVGIPEGQDPEFAIAKFMHDEPFDIDASTAQDPGHSANLAVRKDALVAVGGFDEALGAGGRFRAMEDKDLIYRLVAAGRGGRYEPNARTVHEPWRDREKVLRLHFDYGLGCGVWIVKLFRIDRRRFRRAAKDLLWMWGVRDAYFYARHRIKFKTLVAVVRTAGMVVGMAWGAPYRVENGHIRLRR